MNEELVQWPRAKYWEKAWNPLIGCKPVSPACANCWARAWDARFGGGFSPRETRTTFRPPRKGVVFCGNLTDLFGDWMDFFGGSAEFVARTLGHPEATYLWLTKRPAAMVDVLRASVLAVEDYFERFTGVEMSNQYFGFTAENQECFDLRGKEWLKFPYWANGWLSAEPLLGPIDMGTLALSKANVWPVPFEWVVVGCESGPHRRPCKLEWVEGIVAQCLALEVPVFVKQLDIGGRCVSDIERFPPHLRIRQVPWKAKERG